MRCQCNVMMLLLLAAGLAAAADPQTIDQVIDQLEQVHTFSSVAISPDAHWIAYTAPAPGNASGVVLYLADRTRPMAAAVRITALADPAKYATEEAAAWSPDSQRLAFLSNAEEAEQNEVYVVRVGEDAKPHQVTHLKGFVTDLRWMPGGVSLSFLYVAGGSGGGPLQAASAETGVIGAAIHNQQLSMVKAEGGELQVVSPASLNIYEYDWARDGQRFAAVAAPGPADNNWWTAKLYAGSTAAADLHLLYTPPVDQQIVQPRWSPDGKRIAFIGGLMSDEGFDGGDLFTLSVEGKQVKNVTPGRKTSVTSLLWQTPEQLLVTEDVNGAGAIATLTLPSGSSETLWQGEETLHLAGNYANFSVAADGKTTASIRSTFSRPPEIWSGAFGNWSALTRSNDGQKPRWGKSEKVEWTANEVHAQGWLLYPEAFDTSKHYPMVVSIHGGPAGMRGSTWPNVHFDMSLMASLGYFVFFPNPRGSYGQGEAYTKGNVKDFGHGDLQDILAGVDAVLKKVPVDPTRLGVTGWSYGGYMTMWTVTQTKRFRAAVAGAGIANWQSYYGQNLIDKWMIPYFGASVYDDPKVYAKSSPIEYIKQVKTPTLVVVGERDAECPAPQSYEFWHALRTLNVPTELVVYANEGHALKTPEHRKDVLSRTAQWFNRYLLAEPGQAAPSPVAASGTTKQLR